MHKTNLKRRGFTLIEILVVLVIMGFLTSMVAPKLADMVGSSQQPIEDANLKELSKVVTDFIHQKERVPKDLVNLVHNDESAGGYVMLTIHEPGDEEAEFSEEFDTKLAVRLHALNDAEVKELRRLGVKKVRNYKHTFANTNEEYNEEVALAAGVEVLMIGCGSDDSSSNIVWEETREGSLTDDGSGKRRDFHSRGWKSRAISTVNTYACFDGGPYIGRILMGIDNESELVRKEYLERSGTSPKEARRQEVKWLNYALLLPRLDATVKRMDLTSKKLTLNKYDEEFEKGYGSRTIDMDGDDKQDIGDVVIVSPQGYISKEKNFSYGVHLK